MTVAQAVEAELVGHLRDTHRVRQILLVPIFLRKLQKTSKFYKNVWKNMLRMHFLDDFELRKNDKNFKMLIFKVSKFCKKIKKYANAKTTASQSSSSFNLKFRNFQIWRKIKIVWFSSEFCRKTIKNRRWKSIFRNFLEEISSSTFGEARHGPHPHGRDR